MRKINLGPSKHHYRLSLLLCTAMAAKNMVMPEVAQAQFFENDQTIEFSDIFDDDHLGTHTISEQSTSTSNPTSELIFPSEPELEPTVVVEGPGEGPTLNPGEPDTIFDDTVDVTGVGQFFRADGFVCSGTLINPRTVLFAAHCVNNLAADSYGAASGGIPAAFSFRADALLGFQTWFNSGFQSIPDQFAYNVEQILINPASLVNPQAGRFLEADIALAALDTPAINVPTWAMLFSPLPTPDEVQTISGTGYNVRVVGYGRSGFGANGATQGIDFRRRAAENVLGALASINVTYEWLFGAGNYGLPQNLYQLDFDDPSRTNIFDFNLFRDDARDIEGSTAGGDSGGPLILQSAYAMELVIGVLSGGSRFFAAQPFSTYGTASLYQPLYLHWDWIAANNPYRYAQTVEGDGNWFDPNHWLLAVDPNYYILDQSGELINGVPDELGEGLNGTTPQFGQVCNGSLCLDLATGDIVDYDGNIVVPSEAERNSATELSRAEALARLDQARIAGIYNSQLPIADAENGLPGASGFVPNNIGFTPETLNSPRINARYFDVTLANSGTTTLDAAATIDRLMIAGTNSALDITQNGSLVSIIDVTQMAGRLNVDGVLETDGDYLLFSGALTGNGTVDAQFSTNMMGIIGPGSLGSIGVLTFNGNLVLTSGSIYGLDVSSDGQSDLIQVNSTDFDEDGNPLSGQASLGGTVAVNSVGNSFIRFGDNYVILQAEGGYDGAFLPTDISAILTQDFNYGPTSVTLSINANSYHTAVNSNSQIQLAYASLLDQNRAEYEKFEDLYGLLDLQSASTISSALESFAPHDQVLRGSIGLTALNVSNGIVRNRLAQLSSNNDLSGTLMVTGQPAQAAAEATNAENRSRLQPRVVRIVDRALKRLPGEMSGFISGGYIDGESVSLPSNNLPADNRFDGFYLGGGIEQTVDDKHTIGFALNYTRLDGETPIEGQSAKANLIQGSLYGVSNIDGGLQLDMQFSLGFFDSKTKRTATIPGRTFAISGSGNAFAISTEIGVGKPIKAGTLTITPRAAFSASQINFASVAEQGGGPALTYELDKYESYNVRAGINLAGNARVKPFLNATIVHDFASRPGFFAANFTGGVGENVAFNLPITDHNWAEVAGGIGYYTNDIALSVSMETSIWREEISYQSYQGTLTLRF